MISPLFARASSLSATLTKFLSFGTNFAMAEATSDGSSAVPMGQSGTLQNFYIKLTAAPGAGTSFTFTVFKNNSAQSMAITIADTATAGSDVVNTVSYSAGDTISIQCVPTNTPGTPSISVFVENNAGAQSLCTVDMVNNASNSAANYCAVQNSFLLAASTDLTVPCPTGGTINNLYVALNTAPGAGKSYTITLVKNGTDTTLLCTITGAATTTANDTTHSISVAAGDTLYYRIDPSGTPTGARPKIGTVFTPTTDGESIQTFGATANLATSGNNFSGTSAGGASVSYSTTEANRANWCGTNFTVQKLYAAVDTANAVASWAYTIRSASANTAVTCSITGVGVTTANDTTHTANHTGADWLGLNIVGSTVPTASPAQWGFVTYRAPVVVTNTGSNLLTMGVG